jgi:AcrR family transcriptional regulator
MNAPSREDHPSEIGSGRASYLLPVQQERSRATLERILDAAEALLSERLWEDITIAELVDRAACSVGAFYSRVRTKEALLAFLRDRLYARTLTAIDEHLAPSEWSEHPIDARLRAACDVLIDVWRDAGGVVRAVLVSARREADVRAHEEAFEAALLDRLGAVLLLPSPAPIAHADPARAARVAARMLIVAVRDPIAFRDVNLDEHEAAQLRDDIAGMLHLWLTSAAR